MKSLTKKSIGLLLKKRDEKSHKGDHGHALLIAGNSFCMGAAVIAAKACLRSGIGLLTVNVPKEERSILQTAIPEAMLSERKVHFSDLTQFSTIGIGPGIGTSEKEKALLSQVLTEFQQPIVIDADALNILSQNKELVTKIPKHSILTPHPKEFDRLFGSHESKEARIKTAREKAKELELIIVLKDHKTIITSGHESFINTTGNAGLAKGGSGDALTGIITAFMAQGYPSIIAAQLGVYLHGSAADIAVKKQSLESLLITDVIECLGKAFEKNRN